MRQITPLTDRDGMSAVTFLDDFPPHRKAVAWLLLAHGAGAPMTSPFMTEMAVLLAARGIGVSRFEFSYMAQRRTTGSRGPPPRAERLTSEFIATVAAFDDRPAQRDIPLLIGGKSMGGRVATLVADTLFARGAIIGALALGYPFHPPKKPQALRTAHLEALQAPLLIIQGERDPFGTRAEVAGYALSPRISMTWAKDGNHDLAPRRSSDTTHMENLVTAAAAITSFACRLTSRKMPS